MPVSSTVSPSNGPDTVDSSSVTMFEVEASLEVELDMLGAAKLLNSCLEGSFFTSSSSCVLTGNFTCILIVRIMGPSLLRTLSYISTTNWAFSRFYVRFMSQEHREFSFATRNFNWRSFLFFDFLNRSSLATQPRQKKIGSLASVSLLISPGIQSMEIDDRKSDRSIDTNR